MRIENYKAELVFEFAEPNSPFPFLNSSLAFILMLYCLAFAGQANISLKAQAMVEPGVIRLGQIAEIKGDAELVKRVSSLEVGKVAEPGRKTRVTESVVKVFIKSVASNKDIVFNGAKFSDVTARSGTVPADSLKNLLLREVRLRMPANLQEGKDWKFEAPKMPNSLATPERGGKILVTLSPQFAGIG